MEYSLMKPRLANDCRRVSIRKRGRAGSGMHHGFIKAAGAKPEVKGAG
ncbi:hypothetical protein [uncultured Robinsoniella sp.]